MIELDQESVGDIANDVIIEILQSYMEFVNIMEATLNCYAELPPKIERMAKTLIATRRSQWQPILKSALQRQEPGVKSEKKD